MLSQFKHVHHQVDFCVVGGGMAGLAAALSAARHGARVLLMQDRPVLGGNASSECRVHICGADRHNGKKNMRETGILEELRLENLYRNPQRSFSIWDTILYEKAMAEPNLTLLLNCTCQSVEMDGDRIASVTGWQLTTQTNHTITAKIFADCSGDSILAPLTGALYRMGREGRHEFGESIAPETADERTMGMTCLFQTRQYPAPQSFQPPAWAYRYENCADLPYGKFGHRWWEMGYWWVELGGEQHSIHDTETVRDELLKVAYGVWDHIKNRCHYSQDASHWALDWVQFLPGKRESRRYVGDHILTQNDIEAGGSFPDVVAYGGWTMDDHHPAGFNAVRIGAPATIFHKSPSPYGIPYRSLYSQNIKNLMFAGRNISATHAAMSSARVMGTCMSEGQAVGTAAAMAVHNDLLPAGINDHIVQLQQRLLHDDAYLPGIRQDFGSLGAGLTLQAQLSASQGDPEPVRDGVNRPVGDRLHAWAARAGDWISYSFDTPAAINQVTLVLDSALDQNIQMSYHQQDDQLTSPPSTLPKSFLVEALVGDGWQEVVKVTHNYQRLVRIPVDQAISGVRFTLEETWGADQSKLFAFYLE